MMFHGNRFTDAGYGLPYTPNRGIKSITIEGGEIPAPDLHQETEHGFIKGILAQVLARALEFQNAMVARIDKNTQFDFGDVFLNNHRKALNHLVLTEVQFVTNDQGLVVRFNGGWEGSDIFIN